MSETRVNDLLTSIDQTEAQVLDILRQNAEVIALLTAEVARLTEERNRLILHECVNRVHNLRHEVQP